MPHPSGPPAALSSPERLSPVREAAAGGADVDYLANPLRAVASSFSCARRVASVPSTFAARPCWVASSKRV